MRVLICRSFFIMKLKHFILFSFIFVVSFVSCAAAPDMLVFPAGDGIMYFIPPTEWKTEANNIAKLDITYRTGTDAPAAVNITFIGKKSIPRKVTYAALNGAGAEYSLSNIKVLYADSKKYELRITTEGDRDTLVSLLAAESITLTAEIDGALYTYTPHKWFAILKDDFVITLSD